MGPRPSHCRGLPQATRADRIASHTNPACETVIHSHWQPFQADKLTAIDGIVQYMRPLRNCDYLAGLWGDTFGWDLLWMVGPRDRPSPSRTVEPSPNARKPIWSSPEHLFPTLSWASVTYQVTWAGRINSLVDKSFPEGILVTLVEGQLSETPANEVTLQGILVPTTLGEVRMMSDMKASWYLPDCRDEERLGNDTEVHCLRMLLDGDEYHSLTLRCRDEVKNVYERLGLLLGRGKSGEGLSAWWEPSKDWKPNYVTLTLV